MKLGPEDATVPRAYYNLKTELISTYLS